jgi:hypothetical protein
MDNIKIVIREIGWSDMDWIDLHSELLVSGLCPSYRILNTRKHNVLKIADDGRSQKLSNSECYTSSSGPSYIRLGLI